MEIQELSYENKYHKPTLLPERVLTNAQQESDTFRPAEGVIEVSISQDIESDEEPKPEQMLDHYSPLLPDEEDQEYRSIEELRKVFGENSAELNTRLRQFFSSKGIQAPVAADMTVDSQGRVVVSSSSEQKAALETEFANDPEFTATVAELGSSASILRAADVANDFARAYERNPPTAVAEYPHLFSEKFKFNARFENDNLTSSFKSLAGHSIDWQPNI
jgi:hypothetical protein